MQRVTLMSTDLSSTPGRSLGTRLVIATLGFCFVFTLLTVGVRTLSAWKEAWSGMHADLTLIEHVYRQTLSKSIWEMDRDALRVHVESAAQVASVGRIVLKIHSSSRASEQLEHTADGWLASTLAPVRKLDLVYVPFPGGSEPVGELTLYGDERVLWARLRGEITSIVVTQLLQSLLLAGLIMLMFSRTVTVHVQHIARHLGQITPENLRLSLRLVRNPELHDELSQLELGVNELQGKLADHLAMLHQYEDELGAHRDHLADLVRARTAELESLTAAQQLVLSLSNRLIHAPHGSFEDCQKACMTEVAERLGANHALWLVPLGTPPTFRVFAEWRAKESDAHGAVPIALDGLTQTPVRLAREGLLFFLSQAEMGRSLTPAETAVFTSMPVGACALALLRSDREDFGILFMGKPLGQGDWPEDDRALLAMTSQMLLHSVRHNAQMRSLLSSQDALRDANRQLEILSRHDPLTGLSNRRHFDEMKDDEFQRALRNGQPLTLLICDIDHFKAFNDHYGHAAGDQCLRVVANAMNSVITRSGDALARIGGEEFAILLPATHAAAAWQVAQRVRLAVSELHLPHAASSTGPFVTLSIGLAQLELGRTPHFEALFDEADQALYQAKAEGRNRVCSSLQGDTTLPIG